MLVHRACDQSVELLERLGKSIRALPTEWLSRPLAVSLAGTRPTDIIITQWPSMGRTV